jgi:hypothetical protein
VSWDPPAACVAHLGKFSPIDHRGDGLAVDAQNGRDLVDRERNDSAVEEGGVGEAGSVVCEESEFGHL